VAGIVFTGLTAHAQLPSDWMPEGGKTNQTSGARRIKHWGLFSRRYTYVEKLRTRPYSPTPKCSINALRM